MFESKKRFKELEKRIADLERQVQGQQEKSNISNGCVEGRLVIYASKSKSSLDRMSK